MGGGEAEMNREHKQRKRGINGGGKEGREPHWGTESFQGRQMVGDGIKLQRALVGQEEMGLIRVIRSQS